MGKVSYDAIPKILNDSDILVHVESFEKQQKLATSLSFSTKLVDYFEASKPIFALGWENAASIKYLKNNSIGKTASNPNDLDEKILTLMDNINSFGAIGNAIWQFGKQNHNKNAVLANFEKKLAEMST
jgi:hypothetical protein